MEREFTGSKYDSNLSLPEIAARIRGEIKAAQASGALPACRVSVRSDVHAIRASISGAAFFIQNPERIKLQYDAAGNFLRHLSPSEAHWTPFHSPEGKKLIEAIEAIGQAYNRDNSDIMSDYHDVRFYWFVEQNQDDRERERCAILGLAPAEPEPARAWGPVVLKGAKIPAHVGVMRIYKTWYWIHKEDTNEPRTPRSVDTAYTLVGPRGSHKVAFHYASGAYSLNDGGRTYWPNGDSVEIRRGQFAELPKAERAKPWRASAPRVVMPEPAPSVVLPDWMNEPVTQDETDFINFFSNKGV